MTDSRPDLPSDLARVIRRCLEKDPRHRLQTARDVSNEFRDLAHNATRAASVSSAARRSATTPDSGAARAEEGFWVAVLPFRYTGDNRGLKDLASGLSDEIITGLSRFSYLRVIARGSTAKYSSDSGDVRSIGKELGARYVMEGSQRQAGSKVRIATQLVDASTGAGLWAETYDCAFGHDSTLDLLDKIVPRIVATVGDTQGILPHSMTGSLRNRNPESLTPYEAMLRSFGYHQRVSASEHLAARTVLEAVEHRRRRLPHPPSTRARCHRSPGSGQSTFLTNKGVIGPKGRGVETFDGEASGVMMEGNLLRSVRLVPVCCSFRAGTSAKRKAGSADWQIRDEDAPRTHDPIAGS